MNPFVIGTTVAISLVALLTGLSSFSSVEPGQKGVIVTMGQVVGTADPGVFFKTPFVTNVPVINLRDQVKVFENLEAYTRDQQTATVPKVSVTYRVDPAKVVEVFTRFGTAEAMVEQLLNRPAPAALEQVFGQYNAATAVQERTRLGMEFAQKIKDAVAGEPLVITAVNIEGVSFPPEYEANINARMAAEVEAERATQTAKTTVINAQAAADAQLATAKAAAEAVRLQGEAKADAIRAKGAALRDNPTLIQLTAAEKWNGTLPTSMIPGGAVPFVNVGQ